MSVSIQENYSFLPFVCCVRTFQFRLFLHCWESKVYWRKRLVHIKELYYTGCNILLRSSLLRFKEIKKICRRWTNMQEIKVDKKSFTYVVRVWNNDAIFVSATAIIPSSSCWATSSISIWRYKIYSAWTLLLINLNQEREFMNHSLIRNNKYLYIHEYA